MVRKDHIEQVCVGHPVKSGSFLREGVALVVGDLGRSDLDEPGDAVGEVMPGDVFGVDVQLAEDDFGHGALHPLMAASVEALGIGKEVEREAEELLSLLQPARRVGKLGLDRSALPLDLGEPPLDLLAWPLGVIEQVKQAVFLGVQLVQSSAEALLEGAHAALFHEQSVIELPAY